MRRECELHAASTSLYQLISFLINPRRFHEIYDSTCTLHGHRRTYIRLWMHTGYMSHMCDDVTALQAQTILIFPSLSPQEVPHFGRGPASLLFISVAAFLLLPTTVFQNTTLPRAPPVHSRWAKYLPTRAHRPGMSFLNSWHHGLTSCSHFLSPIVQVVVGNDERSGGTTATVQTFSVNEDLLTSRSPFFAKALKDYTPKPVADSDVTKPSKPSEGSSDSSSLVESETW